MNASKREAVRTNEELSAETNASLVRCAREAFSRLSYEKTSVESVATRAGLSKGAIYYHFKDKAGLFEAVFRDAQAELVSRIAQRARAASAPRNAVLKGCEAFVEIALDDELRQIVLVDAPTVLGGETSTGSSVWAPSSRVCMPGRPPAPGSSGMSRLSPISCRAR